MRRLLAAVVVVGISVGAFGVGYVVGTRANRVAVPDMLGLGMQNGGQAAARQALAGVGLRVGKVGWKMCTSDENGLVVAQNPPAGTVVPKGSTVNIAIGDDGTQLIGLFDAVKPCLPGIQHPAGQPPSSP